LIINEDIDAIIARGEERTIELNSKYEGLNLEDLNNFKSDASVQQWEGEDFRAGVRMQFLSFYLVIASYPYLHLLFSRKKHSTSTSSRYRNGNASQIIRWIIISKIRCVRGHRRWIRLLRCQGRRSRSPCGFFLNWLWSSNVLCSDDVNGDNSQDFQFFPPELAELQERELAVHKVRSLRDFACEMWVFITYV
jgi:hypothetical protein